jgi:hypothetical protein
MLEETIYFSGLHIYLILDFDIDSKATEHDSELWPRHSRKTIPGLEALHNGYGHGNSCWILCCRPLGCEDQVEDVRN